LNIVRIKQLYQAII